MQRDTDKATMRTGVNARKLLYKQGKEYVEVVAEYCTQVLSGGKRKRKFIPVLDEIRHPKSSDIMKETLKGISKYYCFAFFGEPRSLVQIEELLLQVLFIETMVKLYEFVIDKFLNITSHRPALCLYSE